MSGSYFSEQVLAICTQHPPDQNIPKKVAESKNENELVSEASASSECREDINELTGNEIEKSVDEFFDKQKTNIVNVSLALC